MPALGDYVYVHWDIGTQYGTAGTITGDEYTERLAGLIEDGYGQIVDRPANWTPGTPYNPWTAVPGVSPNAAQSQTDVDRRIARKIVIGATQPTVTPGDAPVLWIKDHGNDNYALLIVTGD